MLKVRHCSCLISICCARIGKQTLAGCVCAGEERTQDRRRAAAAPRRGARQVPQQQVTTNRRGNPLLSMDESELCFFMSFISVVILD